jgi:MFS family permease
MIMVLGALGIVMSIPGQTMGVSVFTDALLVNLRLSRDELSVAYMFGTIASSFLLPWAGQMYDRFGVRPVAIAAAFGLGMTLMILSGIDRLLFRLLSLESSMAVVVAMMIMFFFLRFFGQGVLTLTSRNMLVQWFDRKRGFATGFANVLVSLSFSASPLFLYGLIEIYNWRGTWMLLAVATGLVFPIVILIFFRNRPEDSGLEPDGMDSRKTKTDKQLFPVVKQYTLKEALGSYSFWVFSLMLGLHGLVVTGLTFHVVSIFQEAGMPEAEAVRIFLPVSVISVIVTLAFSSLSDFVHLKYLLIAMGAGAICGTMGIATLSYWPIAVALVILGSGITSGTFSVLATVTWPRYFGRTHLGAISGQATLMIVFGSALGPVLFSTSLSWTGSYESAGWIGLACFGLLLIAAVRADNPQINLSSAASNKKLED